jgi:hypothetical protein
MITNVSNYFNATYFGELHQKTYGRVYPLMSLLDFWGILRHFLIARNVAKVELSQKKTFDSSA